MKLDNMLPFRRSGWTWTALMSLTIGANALSQEYCSTENTGSDFVTVHDIYQSNGACHDTCSGYAFAVVQYQNCWCSNYIPAIQNDVSNCNQNCPGYPSEQCGNSGSGYFGYIALSNAPSGTAGAAASTSAAPVSTSSPSPSPTPVSSPSSTEEPETSYTTATSTSSTEESSSQITTSSSAVVSNTVVLQANPVISTIMTTISGEIVTQTVTSTPVAPPGSKPDNVEFHRSNGLSGGAIAGIVIGVLAALAAVAFAMFLLWRRRRNAGDDENQGTGVAGAKRLPGRHVSVLSKSGLLARARPSMGERENDEPFGLTGNNSVRHSMLLTGADGVSPVSPLDSSHSGSSRRPSKPMVYDQRLNPSALFANQEANGSRISMQDQQDYSRPLGVTNPDPRESFESRISRA